MKIAVISDVHANLEALEVCLNEIEKIKPGRVICLGDMVDYGAQPNECTKHVKENCDVVLIGNHDEAQFNLSLADGFSDNAYESSVHTREVISSEYVEYFRSLPYSHSFKDLLFTHGAPLAPERYEYVLSPESARENFKSFKEQVCFIGHSHYPVIFEENNKGSVNIVGERDISPGNRYIINVGSVGQPRDKDPRLSFGIFDINEFNYHNIRIEYPAEITAKKILNEGLPEFLAERLLIGI